MQLKPMNCPFHIAIYNAGCMTTLQLQHYGIYPSVGKEHFAG